MTLTKAIEAARAYREADTKMVEACMDHGYDSPEHDRADDAFMACRRPLDDALATLPDKPMTEAELFDIVHVYFRQQNSVLSFHEAQTTMVIRALKAANVLYVKETK